MKKKILFIVGGRRQGNTFTAAGSAAAAAEAAGAEVRIVEAITLDGSGKGCISCYGCQNSPDYRCVLPDEVSRLVEEVPSYDLVVLATPVYFFSPSTQIKGILDRFFSLIKHEGENLISGLGKTRFAAIYTSGGGEEDSGVKSLRLTMKYFADMMNIPWSGELYFPNCHPDTEIFAEDREMQRRAAEFGRRLATET